MIHVFTFLPFFRYARFKVENEDITLPGQKSVKDFLSKRLIVICIILFVFLVMAADLVYVNISLLTRRSAEDVIVPRISTSNYYFLLLLRWYRIS